MYSAPPSASPSSPRQKNWLVTRHCVFRGTSPRTALAINYLVIFRGREFDAVLFFFFFFLGGWFLEERNLRYLMHLFFSLWFCDFRFIDLVWFGEERETFESSFEERRRVHGIDLLLFFTSPPMLSWIQFDFVWFFSFNWWDTWLTNRLVMLKCIPSSKRLICKYIYMFTFSFTSMHLSLRQRLARHDKSWNCRFIIINSIAFELRVWLSFVQFPHQEEDREWNPAFSSSISQSTAISPLLFNHNHRTEDPLSTHVYWVLPCMSFLSFRIISCAHECANWCGRHFSVALRRGPCIYQSTIEVKLRATSRP